MAISLPGSGTGRRAARTSRPRRSECVGIDPDLGIEAIHLRPGRMPGKAPGEESGEFDVDRHANFMENTLFLHRQAHSEDATIE